jgi:transposase
MAGTSFPDHPNHQAIKAGLIYRQSAILKRETGSDLSRATLDSWVMRVGELLRPITAAMGQELLSGSYLQADETTVGKQL